jgi:diguanylate cyclase (GGDEF)-like protein/PAS domain S-box-containing protein
MTSVPKLLLVNGNSAQRQELAHFIASVSGFEVVEAENGGAAVQQLKKHQVSCVVSDIHLDGLDGWRLARMVRSGVFPCSDTTPFIVVTSTWCERIAETTAREFDIDHLIPYTEYHQLEALLKPSVLALPAEARIPRILAIEDAQETASLIQRVLKGRFQVDIASDGPSGLSLWREHQHPIVLLDVMLPGMSGPEVMAEMLAQKPDQTIVIMTAHGTIDLAGELMLQGASDFLSKPFKNAQLRKVCEIAARRQDFLISNEQFADAVANLRRNETALATQAREHKHVLDNLTTAVLELDHQGAIRFANKAWQNMTGWSEHDSVGHRLTEFADEDLSLSNTSLAHAIGSMLSGWALQYRQEFRLKEQAGQGVWVEARLNRISREGSDVAISVALNDISARKQAEQRLEHMTVHDPLTGLYNRNFFDNELPSLVASARRHNWKHALLYVDIDRFKAINDTLGHQQGDDVLKDVAQKLQQALGELDFLCRIAGDEFIAMLVDVDEARAEAMARTLCETVSREQYVIGGQIFRISCSIGISMVDGAAAAAQDYLKQADIALYVAKCRGRNGVHLFSSEDRESDEVQSSMQWLHAVQTAIAQDSLVLHFQPVYHIASGTVAYYEALVRLQIGERTVFPGEFIPALERFDDIALLDKHVISKAISLLAEHDFLKRVAINLSAQAFRNEELVPLIEEKLHAYGVSPERVIFELTESASLTNMSATMNMIGRLLQMGCSFSIDDFGTGFSTFSYLKHLPAETVKIDGSFISELKNSSIDLALVKSIHQVAKALAKKTVAEFVEDEETLELLREIKVDYAQGYHLGRPQPVELMLETLEA